MEERVKRASIRIEKRRTKDGKFFARAFIPNGDIYECDECDSVGELEEKIGDFIEVLAKLKGVEITGIKRNGVPVSSAVN